MTSYSGATLRFGNLRIAANGLWALAALVLTALAFWPTLVELFRVWNDTDRPYSHGMLVGPISVWLTLRACFGPRESRVSSSWLALALFAGACLIWIVGFFADIQAVQHVLFPVILVLAVASLVGWRTASALSFPLAFLYFAIPIWNYAIPLLQTLTVEVVRFVLDLVQIPVYVEANRVTIPEGVFEIADGCAGLHYFIVAITISGLYSYLNFERKSLQIGFVAIAAVLAVVTNWIRVGSLVLFGHFTNMQHYLITHEHYYYGWVLYAIVLIPTFVIARKLQARDSQPHSESASGAAALQVAGMRRQPKYAVVGVFVFLLVVATFVVQVSRGDSQLEPFDLSLPPGESGWQATATVTPDWMPQYYGADAQALGAYARNAARVQVAIAVYRTQSQGRELVAGENNPYGAGFALLSAGRIPAQGAKGLPAVQEFVVRSADGRQRLVWHWFLIGGHAVAGNLEAKFWQVANRLLSQDSGAAIELSVQCALDCRDARSTLDEFFQAMGNAIAAVAIENQTGAVDR